MKVLLLNGSPHQKGCTFTALTEVAHALQREGIETEMAFLGGQPIHGCSGCGKCALTQRCIFEDDPINTLLEKAAAADGLIVGSPVHYAAPAGALCAAMNRMFYAGGARLAFKPAAAVVSARRGGATAALEVLAKYFTINNMPVVSSQYWPMVHGSTPEEVVQDAEGMQVMRQLGRNMAWLLQCLDAGKRAGLPVPACEARLRTDFIR